MTPAPPKRSGAPAVAAQLHAIEQEREIDRTAARDAQPDEGGDPTAPRWRRCRDLVDAIIERADEPWVRLELGGRELVEVRPGGIVLLIGGTGRGKSSLAASLLVEHAHARGPAIAMSLELPPDEWTARAIGIRTGTSWPDVLRGRLPRARMVEALPDRLAVIERRQGTLGVLGGAIDELRRDRAGEPVLIGVDYVQLVQSDEREVRRQVADAMRRLDELARDRRVVVIALSQGSRASARALSSGERVGADTTDAGAEAAELERWSTATVAIGTAGPEREDGTREVELSVGKSRMGAGDRVVPMSYCGRTGLWSIVGDARAAADVRAERVAERDDARAGAAALAIVAAAERAGEPQTREELAAAAACRMTVARAAITSLLARGELVEVERRKGHARAWKLWTRTRAETARVPIVEPRDER